VRPSLLSILLPRLLHITGEQYLATLSMLRPNCVTLSRNIKDKQFGVWYFKKFSVVLIALVSDSALCVSLKVGARAYSIAGQRISSTPCQPHVSCSKRTPRRQEQRVSLAKPTQSLRAPLHALQCNARPVQKQYPICTIRQVCCVAGRTCRKPLFTFNAPLSAPLTSRSTALFGPKNSTSFSSGTATRATCLKGSRMLRCCRVTRPQQVERHPSPECVHAPGAGCTCPGCL